MNFTKLALQLEKHLMDKNCNIDLKDDSDEVLENKVKDYFSSIGTELTHAQTVGVIERAIQIGVI